MAERKTIYLCLAHMSEEGWEQKYVKEAFDTNWVVPLGPNVNAFEQELERFVCSSSRFSLRQATKASQRAERKVQGSSEPLAKRVVALSSGTAAVHLALIACGVGPGDEVIVQSFTFCASSHPITYLGATPVFVDSERETWNMDPDLLELAIKDRIAVTGRKPKAIVPVALYGMPYQIDRIMEIANRYDIPVIEDAAEGLGSRFNGQVLGTFGKYGVLSFNGNKMITTSGGGALIVSPTLSLPRREGSPYMTADPMLYEQLKEYSREMRNNPTDAERAAWNVLSDNVTGYKFRRQHIIGDYIVDFVCLEKMLVVEIDGEYHNDYEQQIDDAARTEWLAIKGFRVMRFTNEEVIAEPNEFARKVKDVLASQRSLPTGEGWGGADTIMWLATQAREAYPYYQHEAIGYNYRLSNVCAGIGRGQMTVLEDHIAHHKHVQKLYEELLKDVEGVTVHSQPSPTPNLPSVANGGFAPLSGAAATSVAALKTPVAPVGRGTEVSPTGGDVEGAYDSNYWLCTIMLDPELKVKGQENAYKTIVKGAVGGAAGVVHASESAHTDCEPNDNVEALRVFLDQRGIEARPLWKPMHTQPVYRAPLNPPSMGTPILVEKLEDGLVRQTSATSVAYVNGVSESMFKVGMCLPSGPMVTDEDVRYIVESIKEAVELR